MDPRQPADFAIAPELDTVAWLNVESPLTLQALRGRVVMLHAFQMLCPGCVSHGLPQAAAVHEQFGRLGLSVIGLHTVFEHHAAMGAEALAAFVHEYRWRFPIAIDHPAGDGPIPRTMTRYGLQGTPSLVLIDRDGRIRLSHFGRMGDLALGVVLGQLLGESRAAADGPVAESPDAAGCSSEACSLGPRSDPPMRHP